MEAHVCGKSVDKVRKKRKEKGIPSADKVRKRKWKGIPLSNLKIALHVLLISFNIMGILYVYKFSQRVGT